MKTIVKGKNMKYSYRRHEDYILFNIKYDNLKEEDYYRINILIRRLDFLKEYIRIGKCYPPTIASYETYFESDNINYRLNVGEKFEGNTIESIEGTEEGDIIYYIDKVLNVDENKEEYQTLKSKLDKEIKEAEDKIQEELEYRNRLEENAKEQLESAHIRIQREIKELKDVILNKKNKKKWYKFWK